MSSRQRIEYIDAMRGFTMILVVYSHICGFCLGDTTMGFNSVFFLFRLPCFFLISGWLFEPTAAEKPFWQVVRKKMMVQLVPTFIFLLILAPPPLFFSRLGATKGGYWFTFALFEFFVLYLLSVRVGRRWTGLLAVVISAAAFCYDVLYNRYFASLGMIARLLGFLSFMAWRYYLFFYLGTLVRRHFDDFLKLTDRPLVRVAVVAGFCGVALLPLTELLLPSFLVFALGGMLGATMVFTFFRTTAAALTQEHWPGRALQYVGRRTLDIYLLHYFFLPRFLIAYGDSLRAFDSRLLELVVGLVLSLLVVGACLAVSWLVRLSPFLGHYLFGVNYERRS